MHASVLVFPGVQKGEHWFSEDHQAYAACQLSLMYLSQVILHHCSLPRTQALASPLQPIHGFDLAFLGVQQA